MDGHACRLVDNQDISVLVHNIQRQRDRRNVRGRFHFLNMYGEPVSGGQRGAHIGPYAVDQDALRHFLQLSEILIGVALPPEILLHPESGFCFADMIIDPAFHSDTSFLVSTIHMTIIIAWKGTSWNSDIFIRFFCIVRSPVFL